MKYLSALLTIICLTFTATTVHAENPYNGNWTATWLGKGTLKYSNEAKVVIQDERGSFQNQRSNKNNPCTGRKAPIAVKTATADELVFVIEFTKVLQGCKDSEVKLKRVDDKTLKGLRDEDKKITLVKD